MPKSKAGKAAAPSLAVEMLKADHRKVEALFKQYEKAKEADDESRRDIAETICSELTIHATVEEEILYPWLREALDPDDMDMVEEAYVEHDGAKNLIAEIQGAESVDDAYDAKVKVLSEYIKHHVKEEEDEIFPAVAGEKETLDELGQQMEARKADLMESVEVSNDKGMPPPKSRKDSVQPGKTASR